MLRATINSFRFKGSNNNNHNDNSSTTSWRKRQYTSDNNPSSTRAIHDRSEEIIVRNGDDESSSITPATPATGIYDQTGIRIEEPSKKPKNGPSLADAGILLLM